MEGIQTFKVSWPWPWPWIRPYGIPLCISHRPLPVYQISLKSKKLFVDGRTYGRTYGRTFFPPLILLGRLLEVDLKSFYPHDVVSAVYAMATWLAGWVAARVSVTRWYCIKTAKPILKLFLTVSGSTIILISSDCCADTQYQLGTNSAGAIYTHGLGKIGSFRRKLPFISKRCKIGRWLLWNVNRKSWVPDRIVSFSMTLNDCKPVFQGHCIITSWICEKRYILGTKLLKNTNRKSYTVYRMVPLSMTLNDLWPQFQGHDIFWYWISQKRHEIEPLLL